MAHPDGISVIIPNFNGRQLLEENLPPLFKSLEVSSKPFEVIVSDDCSTDDSVAFLQQHYPAVRIASTASNSGFATACNTGLAKANLRFTCIVNSDVTFTETYFRNALEHFSEKRTFAVKGDIVNYRKNFDDVLNIGRDLFVYTKHGFIRFKDTDRELSSKPSYRAVLLGCCFVCRTELFKQLGGYDEIFSPYYREDLDLAMTAIERGYQVLYVPDCTVFHQLSSTIDRTQTPLKKQLVSKRNSFLLTWKHLASPKKWMIHLLFLLASFASRWVIIDWKWYVAFGWALVRRFTFRPQSAGR